MVGLEVRPRRSRERRGEQLEAQHEDGAPDLGVAGVGQLRDPQEQQRRADAEGEAERADVADDLPLALRLAGDFARCHRRHAEVGEQRDQRDDRHAQRERAEAVQTEVA
jgi:hypothetical protein